MPAGTGAVLLKLHLTLSARCGRRGPSVRRAWGQPQKQMQRVRAAVHTGRGGVLTQPPCARGTRVEPKRLRGCKPGVLGGGGGVTGAVLRVVLGALGRGVPGAVGRGRLEAL